MLGFGAVAIVAFVLGASREVGLWSVALLAVSLPLVFASLRATRSSRDRAEQLSARVADLETLNALARELLSARRSDQVIAWGHQSLATALGGGISAAADSPTDRLQVAVPGAEDTVLSLPQDVPETSMALAEAAAGLVGLALQRVEAENELGRGEAARAKLSGQILEEGTRERSRIACQIHNEVLPHLAAATIQADNVQAATAAGDSERADELAALTHEAVHDGIARLREVLDALQHQVVAPGKIREALRDSLEELRLKDGVEGHLDVPEALPALPFAVEILALEVVRGCLANVARHAEATSAEVSVTVLDRRLRVTVRDDGCGFDPGHVADGSHGLALMAQRIELANGRFEVRSAPGQGTAVTAEVPL